MGDMIMRCTTRPFYLAILALAVLTSCRWYERLDPDADGVLYGEDCDDTNPEIGAATPWYVDADNDGFGSGDLQVGCAPAAMVAAFGSDCDDANKVVYPGATEVCGDGVMNACPPATLDDAARECGLDRTYTISEAAQDRHGELYVGDAGSGVGGTLAYALNTFAVPRGDGVELIGTSGERERPFGEHDALLDGVPGEPPSVLYGLWVGRERWLVVGSPSAQNGDIHSAGAAYIVSAAGDGALRAAAYGATLLGAEAGDQLGASVSGGDVNGDGLTDLLVGAPGADDGAGCVALILGGEDESGDPDLAVPTGDTLAEHRRFCGSNPGERAGASLAVADLNGDGALDFAVGAPGQDGGFGAVYGIFGADDGGVVSRDSTNVIALGGTGAFGATLASNGSGELLIGAPDYDNGSGWVTLVGSEPDWGAALGQEPVVRGLAEGDRLGAAMAGGVDLNGDDLADPVLGAPGWDDGTSVDVGALFVLNGVAFTGGSRQVGRVEAAGGFVLAAVLGEETGAQLGASVLLMPELDAIPGAELIVGAPGQMTETTGGAIWLIPGADL